MTNYSFTIEFDITPEITDSGFGSGLSMAALNLLYEAGCNDATFGVTSGQCYAMFDRDGTGPGKALASALMALRVVKGIEVTDINFEKE
jgi:hypothetical protein